MLGLRVMVKKALDAYGKALLADLLINDDTFLLEPSGKQRHESASEFGTHGYHRK